MWSVRRRPRGALLLAGRIAEARDVAERLRLLAVDLPGAAQLLGSGLAGRAAVAPVPYRRLFASQVVVELMLAGETNQRVVVSMPAPADDCAGHARFDR